MYARMTTNAMKDFRSPALAELARQLTRGPSRLRLRQLLSIEFLLSIVEPGRGYPFDFVCHALTGFRRQPAQNDGRDAHLIESETLTNDLVVLAEHLSDDADLAVTNWDGELYSIAQLAERFDVSTKTIFRWRHRGLVGWKFRFPDHRKRVLFAERCIRRFVARNVALVHRGSSFSQLTPAERTRIVARAQSLCPDGQATLNAVAKQIATETGRAVETVRLILKTHDAAHPGAGVFNRFRPDFLADARALAIWEAYQDGASLAALAERFGQPAATLYRTITQARARELKARVVEYGASPEFDQPDADRIILEHPDVLSPCKAESAGPRRIPADLPPYLRQLFHLPLLTHAGEVALFRKMNYLKVKADRRRKAVDPETVSAAELDEIEAWLDEAARVKNQITQANLRLVVSLAKRHTSRSLDFFEIVSDGNVSLMRAVDKFDYTRGFKFSTYASWAIMRNYARTIPEHRHHSDRYQTGRDDVLESVAELPAEEGVAEQLAIMRTTLERMLGTLEQRERCVLRQRYGLDGGGPPQTLEQIGRSLGVSKERIRQLESRAILKLRTDFGADVRQLLGA